MQAVNDGRHADDRREERDAHDASGTGDAHAAAGARSDAPDTGAAHRDDTGAGAGPGGPGGPGRRGPGTGGGFGDHGPHEPDGGDEHGDRGAGDDRGAGGGDDDLDADELALSRLLKDVVQDVTPRPESLDHLRRAVPARRARKRQALVSLAAASVLLAIAVPALVHVSNSDGSGSDRTSVAGHGEEAHGGTAGGKDADGGWQNPGQSSGTTGAANQGGGHGTGDGSQHGGGTADGPDPEGTLAATAPACVAAALGDPQASVGPPDAEGRVYGTFRVTNVSASECTVDGAGTVVTAAQGTADPAKINVVDHTEGDAATRLPSPAQEPGELILKPGTAYEVKFAWVPTESCPAGSGGGDGGSTPGPSPSDGTGSVGQEGSADQTGLTSQLAREGEPVDGSGSVSVYHTAEPGAPSAVTTISNACAGTLYRTGLLTSQ
jgi:hypothetical protein